MIPKPEFPIKTPMILFEVLQYFRKELRCTDWTEYRNDDGSLRSVVLRKDLMVCSPPVCSRQPLYSLTATITGKDEEGNEHKKQVGIWKFPLGSQTKLEEVIKLANEYFELDLSDYKKELEGASRNIKIENLINNHYF